MINIFTNNDKNNEVNLEINLKILTDKWITGKDKHWIFSN